jgi:hypothetical protein
VRSVPTPHDLDWTFAGVVASLVVVGFLFWALGFPSEPFNKTLEEEHRDVRAWFVGHGNPRRFIPNGWAGLPLWCVMGLFRKWSAAEGVTGPGAGVVSLR